MKLIKSHDMQGLHVFGLANARLGAVRELFVDLDTGMAEFIVVEAPSLLGSSGKYHPVPWTSARFDAVANGFQVQMDKDTFKTSPSYDRDQLANANFGWSEQATRFFSSAGVQPDMAASPSV